MFEKNVSEFHLKSFVLNELIKIYLPISYNHFKKLQINIEMITTQWIMTLFIGYIDDPNYILTILDNYIITDTFDIDEATILPLNERVLKYNK